MVDKDLSDLKASEHEFILLGIANYVITRYHYQHLLLKVLSVDDKSAHVIIFFLMLPPIS